MAANRYSAVIDHLKDRAYARLADIQSLHSKANFILATNGIILTLIFDESIHPIAFLIIAISIMLSVVLSVISIHLNVDMPIGDSKSLISQVGEGADESRVSKYLCDSYSDSFSNFSAEYKKKYECLKFSFLALVVAIFVILLAKGYGTYVGQ